MDSPTAIATKLQAILDDDQLDEDSLPETRAELIEGIIETVGWEPVQSYLITVLKNDSAPYRDWLTAAEVFYGAASDHRAIESNLVIALLYKRLSRDEDSSNLAWSIVCKLKKVGYLSDYDPMVDPAVIAAGRPQIEIARL